jgi:calcium/calmodulin-dependent protein kinase I
LARLLAKARLLQGEGRLCTREGDLIRRWLAVGTDHDTGRAVRWLNRAATAPADASERGSDRVESALTDFQIAQSEGELLAVMHDLQDAFSKEDAPESVRFRLVELAMSQYNAGAAEDTTGSAPAPTSAASGSSNSSSGNNLVYRNVGRWTMAVQEAFGQVLFAMATRIGEQERLGREQAALAGAAEAAGALTGSTPNREDSAAEHDSASPLFASATVDSPSAASAAASAHPQPSLPSVSPSPSPLPPSTTASAESLSDPESASGAAPAAAAPVAPDAAAEDAARKAMAVSVAPDAAAAVQAASAALAGLREDHRFEVNYAVAEKIGEGAFASVYRAVHLATGEAVAVKIAPKDRLGKAEARRLVDEVACQAVLKHDHIVRLLALYEDAKAFYIVTELCTGGELFDRIVQWQFSEKEVRDIVRTLAEALVHIHSKGIVHRDLKPENILLSVPPDPPAQANRLRHSNGSMAAAPAEKSKNGGRSGASPDNSGLGDIPLTPSGTPPPPRAPPILKLADLGFAKRVPPDGLSTSCGTPSYVAPDVLLGKRYGTEVDCWSLGVCTYILLCGYAPFAAAQQADLFRAIVAGRFYFDSPYWDKISDEAKDLVKKLLVVDPTRRCSAADVLTHPWLNGSVSSKELSFAVDQMRAFQQYRLKVIRCGDIVKQGHFVRSLRRRTFVLTPTTLDYFEPFGYQAAAPNADGRRSPSPVPAAESDQPQPQLGKGFIRTTTTSLRHRAAGAFEGGTAGLGGLLAYAPTSSDVVPSGMKPKGSIAVREIAKVETVEPRQAPAFVLTASLFAASPSSTSPSTHHQATGAGNGIVPLVMSGVRAAHTLTEAALHAASSASHSASSSSSASSSHSGTVAPFWFKIQMTSGKEYILATDSEATRSDWIYALNTTMQHASLMRKASAAMAGERMVEAVSLVKLAQEWQGMMASPSPPVSGSAIPIQADSRPRTPLSEDAGTGSDEAPAEVAVNATSRAGTPSLLSDASLAYTPFSTGGRARSADASHRTVRRTETIAMGGGVQTLAGATRISSKITRAQLSSEA